ncbi:MAG: DNA polymerase III subunit beta [Bacteroidia bacterium]
MKFIISSTSLLKQLQAISGVLANNSSLPILEDFLFEIEEGQIKVFASDLDNTISTIMKAEASEPGRIAIPAKMLLDSLKSFPDQPLTFLINEENYGIEISSGYGKYKLAGHDPEEFPRLPEIEDSSAFEVDASILFSGINKTIFATGNDDLRPVMSGVFMQVGPDHMTMVATDSHRLVRYRRNDVKAEEDASFILPKKPLNLLKNLLGYFDGNVGVKFNAKNASFTFDNIILICRLIEGRYPNYEAVIPKENPFELTMARQDLMNSIRRVAIFSSRSTNQVKLSIHGSELQLTAEDPDYANSATERLPCQYEGEDMDIAFNSKFISEMLSNLETERIHLHMSAPNRAGILLPDTDTSDKDEDLLMLVMPVMLNN